MHNSISIIPGSGDEVTASGHAVNWDAIGSVNGTPAHGNSPRTFLMKASNFLAELNGGRFTDSQPRMLLSPGY